MDPLTRLRQRRRRHFLNHMIAYFVVMVVVVPLNRFLYPEVPIFVFLMVAWGAPLAVHAAWAMELFGPPRLPPEAMPQEPARHGPGAHRQPALRQSARSDADVDH